MDVDYGNRNCYNYGRFGHLARNCRNRRTENRIGGERRLEYKERRMIEERNRKNSNLKRKGDLIAFD